MQEGMQGSNDLDERTPPLATLSSDGVVSYIFEGASEENRTIA